MIHPDGKQYAKAVLKHRPRPGQSTCRGCAFLGDSFSCSRPAAMCYSHNGRGQLTRVWIWIEVSR